MIGLGNRALSDEGVGCRVACEVGRRTPDWVEVLDAGLPGPWLVALLNGRGKAVIIDAVDAGRPPGTVFRFRPEEVTQISPARRYSLHEGNVLEYVKIAKTLGNGPREVVFIGVQPHDLSPGEKLSPPVEKAVKKASKMALAEVCMHGRFAGEKSCVSYKEADNGKRRET
ncbi:MAG: hydrogenase maturation protease [Deltaproteobacteria bacterium]|nr:hydrogenase maturation protease [Deltaproteobacteria bacterium]